MRQRTVFQISEIGVSQGVPGPFLGTPFIINEHGRPEDEINEYLLARRNGDWATATRAAGLTAEISGVGVIRADLKYLRNRAYHLDAWRRWCAHNEIAPISIRESALDRYAEELEEGTGIDHQEGVLPQTVNQYLISIIDFLAYCVATGKREELGLSCRRVRRRRQKRGKNGGRVKRFSVLRRINPAEIETWYTEAEIELFIEQFETSSGKICARIIHRSGLRIRELLDLTEDAFPSVEEFRADRAKRHIRVVGKFRKTRNVPIDEDLCAAVEKYRNFDRRRLTAKLSTPTKSLILGPKPGGTFGPMTDRYLQREFKRVSTAACMRALSPHLLRHHFAAHFLLRAWRAKRANAYGDASLFEVGFAHTILAVELLVLQRALGHQSLETTVMYLQALPVLMGSNLQEEYAAGLEPC